MLCCVLTIGPGFFLKVFHCHIIHILSEEVFKLHTEILGIFTVIAGIFIFILLHKFFRELLHLSISHSLLNQLIAHAALCITDLTLCQISAHIFSVRIDGLHIIQSEAHNKFIIQFRGDGFTVNIIDRHIKSNILTCQIRIIRILFRKFQVEGYLFSRFYAHKAIFKAFYKTAAAKHQCITLSRTAVEGLSVHLTLKINVDCIAILCSPVCDLFRCLILFQLIADLSINLFLCNGSICNRVCQALVIAKFYQLIQIIVVGIICFRLGLCFRLGCCGL